MDRQGLARFLEDGVIVGDPWLFELALGGQGQARMAITLLRTQAQTAHRTGHIMDLSEEPTRRRIKGASRFDIVPMARVRCMRCGTWAYLSDWVKAMTMGKEERTSTLRSKYLDGTEGMYAFMEPCQGKKVAIETDAAISALLGE
jgi:hypothetical protein